MDLETENRIACTLLKEAAELRRQAEQEGVLAYLKRPSVRARPNSRFLSSTVRGVEQANRAVEVNEMWRLHQRLKEIDNRTKYRARDGTEHASRHSADGDSNMSCSRRSNLDNRHDVVPSSSTSNRNRDYDKPDEEGLKDDEVEEFLRSRVKRGRGCIGSRMDEMGPYISQSSDPHDDRLVAPDHGREERWSRMALGPDRPSWKSKASSSDDDDDDDESEDDHEKRKKAKKSSSGSSKKHHSKKHKSKEKTRDKKRKKKKSRHEKRFPFKTVNAAELGRVSINVIGLEKPYFIHICTACDPHFYTTSPVAPSSSLLYSVYTGFMGDAALSSSPLCCIASLIVDSHSDTIVLIELD